MLRTNLIIELRPIWSRLLLFKNWVPVDAGKPWMRHYLLSVGRSWSKPGQRIFVQKLGTNVLCIFTQKWKIKSRLRIFDISEQLFFIFAVKWWLAAQHLVNDTSKWPPVACFTMTYSLQDFWSQIFSGSADAFCLSVAHDIFFREAKISNFDISVICNQHIFWFKIPIQNILRMKMMKTQQNIGSQEIK